MNLSNRPPRPNVTEWLSIWMRALTRPTPVAYQELFADPAPNRVTALAWLITGGAIAALITMINYQAPPLIAAAAVLCSVPIFAMIYVGVTVVTTRSAVWIAGQMGASADPDRLLYALAAVNAPMSIISALVYLIPQVGYLLSYALGLYWIYLTVLVVKVVTGLSWGKAALASVVFIILSVLTVALGVGVALLPTEI